MIDTAITDNDSALKQSEKKATLTKKLKTTSELTSNLKCFRSLTAWSKVPAMKSRPGPKSQSLKLKLKQAVATATREGCINNPLDLWAGEERDDHSELVKEQLKLCGKHKVQVPKSARTKPNLIAAVQIPDAGVSYNPSNADFKALVDKVVREELSRTKSEERINRSVTTYYQPKSSSQIEAEYMTEMTQGLVVSDADSDAAEEHVPVGLNKKAVRAENRKTKKQRNKEQQVRQATRQMRERKEQSKKSKQPLGLPRLLKEIREREQELVERKKVKELKLKKRQLEPKRKNRHLLPEQVVPDPADMRGSLRTVKVAGNLLEDRFSSLVARSMIEVKKAKKRKSRKSLPSRKLYVKRSHRTDVC